MFYPKINVPVERLREMYINSSISLGDMAKALGTNVSTLYSHLKVYGIKRTKEQVYQSRLNNHRPFKLESLTRDQLFKMFVTERMSQEAIAQSLGVSRQSIKLQLKSMKVARPLGVKRASRKPLPKKPPKLTTLFCPACEKYRELSGHHELLVKLCKSCNCKRTAKMAPARCKFSRERMLGPLHPLWKGGIKNAKYPRQSSELNIWKRFARERDNYTCQICLKRGGKDLQVHHIQAYSRAHDLRFDNNNSMTLCGGCHKEIVHRGNFKAPPMTLDEIREVQALVRDGVISMDWLSAA